MPPDRHPLVAPTYARQDGESDVAWEAFRTYRDMGTSRTLERAREKLGKGPGYSRQLEEWSSQWSWAVRTRDHDRKEDQVRRAAHEDAVAEMARRQAKDAADIQEGLRPIIKALVSKTGIAAEVLADKDPEELALLLKEVMPAMKSAAELERLARGVETEHVKVSGADVLSALRTEFDLWLKNRGTVPSVGMDAHTPALGGAADGDAPVAESASPAPAAS